MQKDFDKWNEQKKILENKQEEILFKEREVWWCSIGLNVGSESCGKGELFRRPILVLKKLSGNNFIGIPLSMQKKIGSWFVDISIPDGVRYVLLYQIRMFSIHRLQRQITTIEKGDFDRVKQKLEALLELSHHHQSDNSGSLGCPKSTDNDNKAHKPVNTDENEVM